MTLDISNDYQIFDRVANEETLTHVSRGLTTNTVDTVNFALGRAVNRQEAAASGGYFTTQDRVWHLGHAEIATPPKEGDQIIQADGVIWHVLTAHHETLKTRWRLVCRKERVGSTLLHTLQGYWKMDAPSGNEPDSVGSTTLTAVNAPGTTTGKLTRARTFNGTNQYFTFEDDSSSLSAGTGISFTLGGWFQITTLAGYRMLMEKWREATNNREWRLLYDFGVGRLAFWVSSTGANLVNVNADSFGVPVAGTPFFVVAWHDADRNTISIQVNDGDVNSAAHSSDVFDGAAPFRVGADGAASPTFFHEGWADDFFFAKRVYSAAERKRLYNGGLGLGYPFHAT